MKCGIPWGKTKANASAGLVVTTDGIKDDTDSITRALLSKLESNRKKCAVICEVLEGKPVWWTNFNVSLNGWFMVRTLHDDGFHQKLSEVEPVDLLENGQNHRLLRALMSMEKLPGHIIDVKPDMLNQVIVDVAYELAISGELRQCGQF